MGSTKMKAAVISAYGEAENLQILEVARPVAGNKELLVQVKCAGTNRADIMQRQGKYPPPSGASEILGLEVAGIVEQVPENSKFKIGDKVFGLISGGGYAEYATIHEEMAMTVPENFTFEEAAAISEVFLTAYQALIWLGELKPNETVLIHAGASGVGTAAIQIAKEIGAKVIITASKGKHALCKALGADHAFDYKDASFFDQIRKASGNKGIDLIIDFIGKDYFHQNIDTLKVDGRLIMLAAMSGGNISDFDLRKILIKRIHIKGSTLRSRSLDYQIQLTNDFKRFADKLFITQKLKPVIDSIFNLEDVVEAHKRMEQNKNAGKIILRINY